MNLIEDLSAIIQELHGEDVMIRQAEGEKNSDGVIPIRVTAWVPPCTSAMSTLWNFELVPDKDELNTWLKAYAFDIHHGQKQMETVFLWNQEIPVEENEKGDKEFDREFMKKLINHYLLVGKAS